MLRKPKYPEKNTNLSQVTDKDYHIFVVSSTLHHERGFELTTLVVIGTDCRDSENPTTTMAPLIFKKVGEN